ncbi:hypothetical protein ACVNS2_13700 [Paenibacillus caseinilyticus]|uniref:GW domain-containing protein n=1 Tax=Paenibacillus mucilaginosus K02 TaxID=997761 RepID=I0BH42_9BACL|nr:hypothetical protein [Paenibacillus mucilaginosus]AFH61689.1 hypothetical protein B2K_13335 [Paenibacillus mucilaginosus K02]AFK65237.1 hypothetical protein [Paenibacillus mucilaginosus K02]
MWKKPTLAVLLGISLTLLAAAPGSALEYADTPTLPADGDHIPKTVTLLKETPYYAIPNVLLNQPEGAFSPQTVEIVEAEAHWAAFPNWWKIRTVFGDRWIKTEPGTFEVPLPSKLTLLQETPIYAKADERLKPSAVLSPQEVTVAGAEKRWFYSALNDENEQKWIQIETSWLGRQWIRLPMKQIGSLKRHSQIKFYGLTQLSTLPPMLETPGTSVPAYEGRNRILTETGEFITPLGSFYEVETTEGRRWTRTPGQVITASQETLTRSKPAALYPLPSLDSGEPVLVDPQILKVSEKIEGDPVNDYDGGWYHVKAAEGEGWFNARFSEPEDAKPVTAEVDLRADMTPLYLYPDSSLLLHNGILSPQKVQATAYWDAPKGERWFRIQTFLGDAWMVLNPLHDRIRPAGREQDQQIYGEKRYQGYYYMNNGVLPYGEEKAGYERQNELYFRSSFLAKMYHFYVSGPDADNGWTFTHESGYAFRLKAGEKKAELFWKGRNAGTALLSAVPAVSVDKEAPDLRLDSMRALFGASTETAPDHSWVSLSSSEYTLGDFKPPVRIEGNVLRLSALLYDVERPETNETPNRLKLYVIDRDADRSMAFTAQNPAAQDKLFSMNMNMALYDLTAQKTLKPGLNRLTAVFKVGERIIHEQDFDVTAQ